MRRPSPTNLKIIFISTWPPRPCGIATFCRDLAEGIRKNNSKIKWEVLTLTPKDKTYKYGKEVTKIIWMENLESYQEAASYINNLPKNTVVCLQHEFGIYGGEYGNFILSFLDQIKKPKIIVIHSTLCSRFSGMYVTDRLKLLKKIGTRVDRIVVITNLAKNILGKWGIFPKEKIVAIGHGIPDFIYKNSNKKAPFLSEFKGKRIIGGWGIFTNRKGYEYAIMGMPRILKFFPNTILYLAGRISSDLKLTVYRDYLNNLITQLKLQKKVVIREKFLKEEEVRAFLHNVDIFITPYTILDSGSSGTLAFAMGAGKPIISTPYLFAEEMLKKNRGMLIPFTDRHAFSEAVIDLFSHPSRMRKMGQNAKNYTREFSWKKIAKRYLDLFREVLNESSA